MTHTAEQKRAAYKKLPPQIQSLVMDNETTELIANALKEAGLNEDQADLADSEILHAMYCLQSLDGAIDNIARLSRKKVGELLSLKAIIQKEILSKYKIDIEEYIALNKKGLTDEKSKTVDKTSQVDNLNNKPKSTQVPEIALEIHPMIEEGETVHDTPPQATSTISKPVEPSIPTPPFPPPALVVPAPEISIPDKDSASEKTNKETSPLDKNFVIKDYKNDGDPYREPLDK
jgi:hypothetical protein